MTQTVSPRSYTELSSRSRAAEGRVSRSVEVDTEHLLLSRTGADVLPNLLDSRHSCPPRVATVDPARRPTAGADPPAASEGSPRADGDIALDTIALGDQRRPPVDVTAVPIDHVRQTGVERHPGHEAQLVPQFGAVQGV